MVDDRESGAPKTGAERRVHARFDTQIHVDCRNGENFLFAYITNISEMGIFIRTDQPSEIGTELDLQFSHDGIELDIRGEVVWVNPIRPGGENLNPGMGVRFLDLTPELRESVVSIVRTVAYLQDDKTN